MIESNFRNKKYKDSDTIRILNPKQAAFYWDNKIEPLDIYPSTAFDTGEPVIVYVFSRSKTQDAYEKWCNRRNMENQIEEKSYGEKE